MEINEELLNFNINTISNLYTTDPQSFSDNLIFVGANQKYTSINTAISASTSESLLILMPEYFDEDVTITSADIHLLGYSKDLTKIKSLTVTGAHSWLENLSVSGSASFLSQATYVGGWNGKNSTVVKNVAFYGNVDLGNSTTSLVENTRFEYCDVVGGGTISINYGNNAMLWYHSFIRPTGTNLSDRSSINIYNGDMRFSGGRGIYINSINYINTDKYSVVGFYHCFQLAIGAISTVLSTQYHILIINNCVADLGTSSGSDLTFSGKFELDLINSSIAIWKNIIFNSSANSRFDGLQQRGYTSTTAISGTGLSYLRIYRSTLKCAAPVGLGGDSVNAWSAFIDN